jgi:hypothetical protein
MKKEIITSLLLVSLFFSCATGYRKTTVDDARFGKGFDPFRIDTYKAVSEAYIINASRDTITIADSNFYPYYGLELTTSEDITNRFDPKKKYIIKYSVVFQYHGNPQSAYVDSIEGLELLENTGTSREEEQPESSPSTYLEKSLRDIVNSNLSVREACLRDGEGLLHYKIISNAYLEYKYKKEPVDGYWFINMYDEYGTQLETTNDSDFIQKYRLNDNPDFNSDQLYLVKYTLDEVRVGFHLGGGIHKRVRIDSIEGLLTYEEARIKQMQEREEQEARETLAKYIAMDNVYAAAVSSEGIEQLKEYINTYAGHDHFNADSYREIAKKITRNNNTVLETLYTAPNPYAFNEGVVYYGGTLSVNQWIDKKAVAYINSFIRDDGNIIVIKSFPDISKIDRVIQHSFLRYTGVTKIGLSNGGTIERPTFDLLCHW